jgi:hypothetical protein
MSDVMTTVLTDASVRTPAQVKDQMLRYVLTPWS